MELLSIPCYEQKECFFLYTPALINNVIKPMAEEGKEPILSTGDPEPIAVFSENRRRFTDFFKQKFGQILSTPIDNIRESILMDMRINLNCIGTFSPDTSEKITWLDTRSPILLQQDFSELTGLLHSGRSDDLKMKTYSTVFHVDLRQSLCRLVNTIKTDLLHEDMKMIILDDTQMNEHAMVMPMAMVVGCVHQMLLNMELFHQIDIVVVTGEVFDSHSAACMIGYGATMIYPYFLYSAIGHHFSGEENHFSTACQRASQCLSNGVRKIISKSGIKMLSDYRGASMFDVIGLSHDVVSDCFCRSPGFFSGLEYRDIEKQLYEHHLHAFSQRLAENRLPYKYAKETLQAFHQMVKSGCETDYEAFSYLADNEDKKSFADYFELKSDRNPIDICDVETSQSILKRFSSAAMSLGAISPEAHECLAEAMNGLGAKSNSGEGGEDKVRYQTNRNSKIKQVAAGRFGVTPEYLVSAQELQIKISQGAKPGEGAQLPGTKVTGLIARLRHTTPGASLISPPSHHDLSSLSDLKQLVFDLRQINPDSIISVKLASTSGLADIVLAVSQAHADKVVISGADGGTGAAPATAIRYAGLPFDMVLSEVHDALKKSGLRDKMIIEVDGSLRTATDVVKAAILGADEFSFGTAALISMGCTMCRTCSRNKCPAGIATQNPQYRRHFSATVQQVQNYFMLLAGAVRHILADLGYSSINQIIGQTHLLQAVKDPRVDKFSLRALLPSSGAEAYQHIPFTSDLSAFQEEHAGLLQELQSVIENPQHPVVISRHIDELSPGFATRVSGEIAKRHGDQGLPADSIVFNIQGNMGASAGAFLIRGMNISINGSCGDFTAKGMSGGLIAITSPQNHQSARLSGNSCLYGATGGELYMNGLCGDRFAVRNSGAIAVVEGVGDHACEYMTGGVIVILGSTGMNFGAGMTGGTAYVYDEQNTFYQMLNPELVTAKRVEADSGSQSELKKLIEKHYQATRSLRAHQLLENFTRITSQFWLVTSGD